MSVQKSKQRHLIFFRSGQALLGPASFRPRYHAVFSPQDAHEFSDSLAIGGRYKRVLPVALAIVLDQVREMLFEKGHEDLFRAGLQEKWVGIHSPRASLRGRPDYGFKGVRRRRC